jgi:tetratricopeptide (TPR) repeat protein/phage FluMu protein gp41
VIAGRYQVESLLGRGGMGAVYAVRDVASGRRVALKLLSSTASQESAALFEREYQTLAGLRHPSIVEVYDYGTCNDGVFYTMELIDGTDLSKQAPMSWHEVCRDLRDAASILGLLHARLLLHRDLSPRNLLRSRTGRLKLIDFGALAAFGPSTELVGTPPFIAPEALGGEVLDQRTDLFALGALAYWLLTGSHAYPARTLGELPLLWEHSPTAPSELLRRHPNAELPPIPRELDELVDALLRIDPAERLASTAELIDRLGSIAELKPEAHDLAIQGYLDSKVFVGRLRERERALLLLGVAEQGQVRTLLVEGDAGVGRSRFLQELTVVSRIAGGLSILASGQLAQRPYGVAETLLRGLLHALPEQAQRIVARDAILLSTLSPELRAALPAQSDSLLAAYPPSEMRVRLLAALREVILDLSRDRLLVLLVDDVQAIDEESQALLATLVQAEDGHRLLLIAAFAKDIRRDTSAALTGLRNTAARVRLLPFSPAELLELFGSVFGQAPYLERLSERLHRATEGNPAYCLELAEHLVHSGVARYQDGMWSLPTDLRADDLPPNREAGHVARLARLTPAARTLAVTLSAAEDTALSPELCAALAGTDVRESLRELEREDVLRTSAAGYRFTNTEQRRVLYAELSPAAQARVHLRLGIDAAASRDGPVSALRAAAHFIRGDDLTRAQTELRWTYGFFERTADYSAMTRAAPLMEDCYLLLRARGADRYATVGLLGMLCVAGYFADRKYAVRHGDVALADLSRVLQLGLAARLTRYLGGKLALIVALVVAGVSLGFRKDRAPPLAQVLNMLLGGTACLAGTATICLDPEAVARYADVLRPFAALGTEHAASVIHEYCRNLQACLEDHAAEPSAKLRAFVARLERPGGIRDLPDAIRISFVAGSLISLGAIEIRRAGPECLQIAERLDGFGPLFSMSADGLRASYHASQGQLLLSQGFRKRMEVHAMQLGTAWQVEAWAPSDAIHVSLRTNDAAMMKRAAQELGRLVESVPSLRHQERHARAAYLVLRRKYYEAVALLEAEEQPHMLGWARAEGVLARAYNGLGRHERAREICLEALSGLTDDDLRYVVIYMNIQVELALAEAALGHLDLAKSQLDSLLARHTPDGNPITRGNLHEAYLRVALRVGDVDTAGTQLALLEQQYRATDVVSLIELIAPLKRELGRLQNPWQNGDPLDEDAVKARDAQTRVDLLLSEIGMESLAERAKRGLQLALELSSAEEGFIVMAEAHGTPVAHLGDRAPSAELVSWAEQNILDASMDEQTQQTDDVESELNSQYKAVGQMRYCVMPLLAWHLDGERVVAGLVLGFDDRVPRMPEPAVIRAIAQHLVKRAA